MRRPSHASLVAQVQKLIRIWCADFPIRSLDLTRYMPPPLPSSKGVDQFDPIQKGDSSHIYELCTSLSAQFAGE